MDLLRRILNEQYLVLEIGPETVEGFGFALDNEKRITPLFSFGPQPWGAPLPRSVSYRKPTAMIACDSKISYTVLIPVHSIRERIREPLRQIELENILSQAISKNINQCRKEASTAMDIDEIDVLLAKSRVVNFTIDDHQVLNPLGFRAQKIECLVELTFTTRAAYKEARRLTGREEVFYTEAAIAELSVLNRVTDMPIRLLRLRPWQSSYFIREPAQIGYSVSRGELGWTASSFTDAIKEAWGVSNATAFKIYTKYLENEYAQGVLKYLSKLVKICTQMFMGELAQSKLPGKVFMDANIPLPFDLPLAKKGMHIEEPPLDTLLSRFGFTLSDARDREVMPRRKLFAYLAPFFEHFYDRSQGELNLWLRKHLHWLGAPMEKNVKHL
ncbi:MAG: hypothetical protein V1489_01130 [Candidatus Liptonbacteria bacterium]